MSNIRKYNSAAARIVLAFLMIVASIPALAQVTGRVQGKALGSDGKPITGATVQMVNADNGRKYEMKTDKNGEFLNIGVIPGTYNCTLIKDGQVVSKVEKFPVTITNEVNELNFDVQADQAAAQQAVQHPEAKGAPKMSEEDRKKMEDAMKKNEEAKAYNAKVGNLNQMLKQAGTALQAKDYAQAEQLMQQGVQIDPNQPLIWGRLGDAQEGEKKYKECSASYQKAIELQQNAKQQSPQLTAGWYNNLGTCQAKGGDTQTAMQSFDKSAQMDPTMASQAYFNEGAILTNMGKPDEANQAFDKSIAADPNKAEAYYQKAINLTGKATTDKSGKIVPAPGTIEALQKYLELAPTGPNADAAKQLLQSFGETVNVNYGKTKKK